MEKRLYRSNSDRIIAGVCGGLGNYLGIDPVLVRVVAVVLAAMSFGTVLVIYILLALIIPLEPTVGQSPTPPASTDEGS